MARAWRERRHVEAVNNLGPQRSGLDAVLLWDGDGGTPSWEHRVGPGAVPQARGRQDERRCRDDEHAAAAAVAGL